MSKKRDRPTHLVTREVIETILENHRTDGKGRAFTVLFTKRSDGTKRLMNCRYGVVSKLKGGQAPFNFSDKNLHSVYDLVSHDYRSIPLDTIEKVTIEGIKYEVV
jgi:hypothetical protein